MTAPLRVAVVGAGPAGLYAIGELLAVPGLAVEIDLIERLPTPWGLIRAGVAPDHPEKKQIVDRLFASHLARPELRFFGNVQVGRDVAADELAQWYDAVIYAVGAAGDAALGIPGEQLPGCWSAREFVAWYNGHPDQRGLPVDLHCERAVIVGNGNVALDLARMLVTPAAELARTDIADAALATLRGSQIREVHILGRRGSQLAAFHNTELEELGHVPGLHIRLEGDEPEQLGDDWETRRKLTTLRQLAAREVPDAQREIVLRFHAVPLAIGGRERVEQIALAGRNEPLAAGLVLRAIGYRSLPLPGLPFDERRGVIENIGGRVACQGSVVAGSYVTGWVKRGPRGIIGSNKKCANETVRLLLEDHAACRLPRPVMSAREIHAELLRRQPALVDHAGWRAIDRAERRAGASQGRPRVKMVGIEDMLRCAGA